MANTAVGYDQGGTEQPLEAMTHRCIRYGHREFVLRWDDRRTMLADVRELAEALERAVARGVRFEPGGIVRVGWVPLRVIELPSRALTLIEPDFTSTPLRYAPGVDSAIAHLRAQEELAERVGLLDRLVLPSLDHTARVCPFVTAEGGVLDRSDPSGDASGWIVGCGLDSDGEDRHPLTTLTLYELVCRFPHLVDVLALPPGCTVACTNGGDALVWHDGEELGVRSGRSITSRLSRVTRCGSEQQDLARCSTIR